MSEIGVSDVVFLGNLQMNTSLAKWMVLWLEMFWMDPDLVNWTEFCMEIPISGERGVEEGFSLKIFI